MNRPKYKIMYNTEKELKNEYRYTLYNLLEVLKNYYGMNVQVIKHLPKYCIDKCLESKDEYEDIIDKATEILKAMKHADRLLEGYSRISNIDKLLNILQGDEKE